MRRKNTLVELKWKEGIYVATMYNSDKGWYNTISFMFYPKKEVIQRLRSNYDCSVSHDFY